MQTCLQDCFRLHLLLLRASPPAGPWAWLIPSQCQGLLMVWVTSCWLWPSGPEPVGWCPVGEGIACARVTSSSWLACLQRAASACCSLTTSLHSLIPQHFAAQALPKPKGVKVFSDPSVDCPPWTYPALPCKLLACVRPNCRHKVILGQRLSIKGWLSHEHLKGRK